MANRRKRRRSRSAAVVFLLCLVLLVVLMLTLAKHFDRLAPPSESPSASVRPSPTPKHTPEPEPTPDPAAVAALAAAALEPPKKLEPEETLARLEELARWDSRFLEIRDRAEELPEALLVDVANNPELLEFTLAYPVEQMAPGEFTAAELAGEEPLLMQYDPRWGYANYGSNCLAVTGCGPTCLSMAILHFLSDPKATPDRVAAWALENDYYVYGAGTKWSLFTEGAAAWGLEGKELGLWKQGMYKALDEGKWIVLIMDTGRFTVVGHFIVICGYDEEGFQVLDPFNRARSGVHWTYEQISDQISNLWTVCAAGS